MEPLTDSNINSESNTKLEIDQVKNDLIKPESKIEIDAKQRKKLDKLADSILKKCVNSQLNTIEDKYYALIEKLMEEQEKVRKLQITNKDLEKNSTNINKQKDQIQNDYAKALFAKDKLESLCRELQKHNKSIKEENLMRIKEEEDKRKEITAKFQTAIDEINKSVSENSDKNSILIKENNELAAKLKNLLEQYEVREQHIEKVLKHKDLEVQLADAKLQQSELKFQELTEKNKNEKTLFESSCNELLKKCEFHQESEKQLKAQLSMYTEKYEEFQNTLKKSNQVFENFKTEMDKMTKKIKKLEQETSQWKNKWEACDKSLQNVVKQKTESEEKIVQLQNKYETMEKISRALQVERTTLIEKIKSLENQVKSQFEAESNVQIDSEKQENEL